MNQERKSKKNFLTDIYSSQSEEQKNKTTIFVQLSKHKFLTDCESENERRRQFIESPQPLKRIKTKQDNVEQIVNTIERAQHFLTSMRLRLQKNLQKNHFEKQEDICIVKIGQEYTRIRYQIAVDVSTRLQKKLIVTTALLHIMIRISSKIFPTLRLQNPSRTSILVLNRNSFNFCTDPDLKKKKEALYNQATQQQLKKAPQEEGEKQSYDLEDSSSRMGLVFVGGAMLIVFLITSSLTDQSTTNDSWIGKMFPRKKEAKIGGNWKLIGTNGLHFGSENLKDTYYLIYFGFTKCKTACPTNLYKIASTYRVIRNLPDGTFMKLKLVFVSVDPDRDTLTGIKDYLSNFHKSFIGVTGLNNKDPSLIDCMKKFKVLSEKIDGKEGFDLNHSTLVYLISPQGKCLCALDPEALPHKNAQLIMSSIFAAERQNNKTNFK